MYRFMLRPKWIISHVLVLALIITMINLSEWQVRRLDQKKDVNRQIVNNTKVTPLDLNQAVADASKVGPAKMQFRRVTATGTYDPTQEVAIRGHTLDGAPGRWVATPLQTQGGPAVLVVRGFIPEAVADTDPPIDGVEPPSGPVNVTGYLMPTETRGFFGSTDAPTGTLHELSRVDVKRFAKQFHAPIAPFWIQLSQQTPKTTSKQADLLTPVPLPALDEGPHFSYAVQWAIFTAIAILGYPLVLRRVAQQEKREREAEERAAGGEGGDGDRGDGDGDDVPPTDGDDPGRDRGGRREAEVG
jgi:cytochrome oxidase assembly protein ShyY1